MKKKVKKSPYWYKKSEWKIGKIVYLKNIGHHCQFCNAFSYDDLLCKNTNYSDLLDKPGKIVSYGSIACIVVDFGIRETCVHFEHLIDEETYNNNNSKVASQFNNQLTREQL